MYLRIMTIFILMAALVFIFRKPILARFYVKLAIGKTTSFLQFLEQKLTKNKGEEPETTRQKTNAKESVIRVIMNYANCEMDIRLSIAHKRGCKICCSIPALC